MVWFALGIQSSPNGANDTSLSLQCLCNQVSLLETQGYTYFLDFSVQSYCLVITFLSAMASGLWKQLSPMDVFIIGYGVRGESYYIQGKQFIHE